MKKNLLALSLLALLSQPVLADVVYITSNTSNCTATAVCGSGFNQDLNINGVGVFSEVGGAFTGALCTTPDKPLNAGGARYYSGGFTNGAATLSGVTLSPTLGVTGGVYKVYHVFSSTANNVNLNGILGVTNNDGCTLSFTETDKFQRSYGQPAPQQWQLLGFLTNNADTSTPTLTFYYQSGVITATDGNRLVVDTFRFTLYEPCTDIPTVGVTGPLAPNSGSVVVTGVSNVATKITVYQDSGAGMLPIGTLSSGIVAGVNNVPVAGLVKGAQVAATQTFGGQEGCTPTAGVLVGGGANPRVRVVLSVRETASTGPVGVSGSTAGVGGNIHFLGASTRIGGAPGDGPVLSPANTWQTLTFDRGTILMSNASNAVGAVNGTAAYAPNDTVAIRVYAYRTVPENNVKIFSRVPAQSAVVTSNDFFSVYWTWDVTPGAEGYLLLRNYNSDNYTNNSLEVFGNSFEDYNSWGPAATATPSQTQTNASVKWFAATGSSAAGTTNDLQGQWGTLDAIALAIDDLTDTGPYDLYIDNLQNGSTVFQNFENAVGNTAEYGFRDPGLSGTTSVNILGAPNSSRVSVRAADTGMKALHVKFQWNGTNNSKWLRLTTSTALGVSNPQINLDDPTSIRLLMLPVGGSLPAQPGAPTMSISNNAAGQPVLSWTGGHNLQAANDVTGTYTNTGVTIGPWTNTLTDPEKFFRLSDPYDN